MRLSKTRNLAGGPFGLFALASLGLFALASMKASKSASETRHSLPILKPRRWPFRSHCVTVRSFI